MAKKQFFAIVDTETTVDNTVADLGIVICDRQGNVHNKMGVLIKSHFGEKELFYNPNDNGFWGKVAAQKRQLMYTEMLNIGTRMLASVGAVNAWIAKAIGQYDPVLTAYNLAFDVDKCHKTQIDLTGFKDSFCLWQAAVGNICNAKAFKAFAIQHHAITNRTEHGNMTIKTNAEIVAAFLAGEYTEEPHTALEDALHFELPVLREILKKKGWRDKVTGYNYRNFQLKDHVTVK